MRKSEKETLINIVGVLVIILFATLVNSFLKQNNIFTDNTIEENTVEEMQNNNSNDNITKKEIVKERQNNSDKITEEETAEETKQEIPYSVKADWINLTEEEGLFVAGILTPNAWEFTSPDFNGHFDFHFHRDGKGSINGYLNDSYDPYISENFNYDLYDVNSEGTYAVIVIKNLPDTLKVEVDGQKNPYAYLFDAKQLVFQANLTHNTLDLTDSSGETIYTVAHFNGT